MLLKDNPDAELQGKLLAEDPNPIDSARRTLKPALKQKQETGDTAHIRCDAAGSSLLKFERLLLPQAEMGDTGLAWPTTPRLDCPKLPLTSCQHVVHAAMPGP